MLPSYDEYGSWPTSGEIDLVESRGDIIFIQTLFSTLKQRKISFVLFELVFFTSFWIHCNRKRGSER